MTLRNDGLQPGDIKFKPGDQVPLETDGTVEKGNPVTFAADGRVTPAADGEAYVGQAGESSRWDGHVVDVRVAALCVVAAVSGGITAGDYALPDGLGGVRAAAADGTEDTLHMPFALHDAADGETVVLCYR